MNETKYREYMSMPKPEDKVKIEGEVAFPFFRFEATYVDENDKMMTISNICMLPAETTEEASYEVLRKWWHLTEEFKKLGVSPQIIDSRYLKHEVWKLQWFCHFTYDIGQSDRNVLNSFEKFVKRTPAVELMGAEERWRWYGNTDKKCGEQTKAPCRCKDCENQGYVRIAH